MNIVLKYLENKIQFSESKVYVLEISNKKLFSNIVTMFNQNINYANNKTEICCYDILENEILLDKNAQINFDVFNFDFNSKPIITKLYSNISKILNQDNLLKENLEKNYISLLANINNVINEIDLGIDYNQEMDFQKLLKLLNVNLTQTDLDELSDKITRIIEVFATLKICKIIVFVNLKNFLSNEEIEKVYKTARYYNIYLLLLENSQSIKLDNEKKLTIDDDFFETLE